MANVIRTNFEAFCARSDAPTAELTRVLAALNVSQHGWCAGGAVRRTLIQKPLDSDFDLFFKSQDALNTWKATMPDTLRLLRETEHHTHWKGVLPGSDLPVDVQAIRFKFYQTAEEVIDSFDYTITQFCLDGDALVTTDEALWDLGRRKLAIHKVTYPVATMRRMMKYMSQGFTACAGTMGTLLRETANHPEALASLDIQYVD